MRLRVEIISKLLLLSAILVSCSESDDVTQPDEPLLCHVVLNVGIPNGMRMANSVVQDEGQAFRGIGGILVIPFKTEGAAAVAATDQPLISTVTASEENRVEDKPYYYVNYCSMMSGTNRVLVYGEAYANNLSETQSGTLETNLTRMIPQNITFNLQSICSDTDASATFFDDGRALASYMTTIANTAGWSNASDSQMKGLYQDFINAKSEGNGLMGGSAAHIAAYVDELKSQLTTIKTNAGSSDAVKDLCAAIIANIDADAKSCLKNNYPASKNLPDGAAALRWTGSEFAIRTQTTTLDNINGIDRYTYPAALWYYVDSPIRTSNEEVEKSAYETTSTWASLLTNKYQSGNAVEHLTKSVAVENPLQYGVARLQMTLKPIPASPLKDSKDNDVTYDAYHPLTLTGVIIGGQHTVGFDFKPRGEKSDVDARFIYDPIISGVVETGENAGTTINTLVLQSYDGEKVPVVLEFLNETDQKFYGKDGVIYPNTKFYLIGELDPAEGEGTGDVTNRVFTQDHVTTATMRVVSLANAYSCMPDLLEARLEIGVQVVIKWKQSTTTTVKL